jgi:peptide chain release factor 3
VRAFLDGFVRLAPPPGPRAAGGRLVAPDDVHFSGFVFKIQANLDPRHRDSVAFLRVCSGRVARDLIARQARTGRLLRLARPHRLFGRERNLIEEAYPGDVVGLVNPHQLAVGDTLHDVGGATIAFDPLPRFAPENFALLHNTDTARYKQFWGGLRQLESEGAIQVLLGARDGSRAPILAAVGELQFDVVRFRLQMEYGVHTTLQPLPYRQALWLDGSSTQVAALPWGASARLAYDRSGRGVGLFDSESTVRRWQERVLGSVRCNRQPPLPVC